MRALHVFPTFSPEPGSGASQYQLRLTREVGARGVEVEVLTTDATGFEGYAPFGLRWRRGEPAREPPGGLRVRRLPIGPELPAPIGRRLSAAVLRRWEREGLDGAEAGADAAALARLARTRPTWCGWAAVVGRGPVSLPLARTLVSERRRWDVILVGSMPFAPLVYVPWLARRLGIPTLALPLFHANDPYHHFRPFYRAFERADRVLAQTPHAVDLFRSLAPASRPVEIGVGVDPWDEEAAWRAGLRLRRELGLADRRVVLFVGRKEPGKRWDVAVEAVERLRDPSVVLLLVGRDTDRRPLGSRRVVHVQSLPHEGLAGAYAAADVLLHPGEHESFGFVVLEAWAAGKPVVASRTCGAVASVVRDNVDGLLCSRAEEYAAALRRLLSDRPFAAMLGARGRARALERYSWRAVTDRVLDVYEEVVRERRQADRRRQGAGAASR